MTLHTCSLDDEDFSFTWPENTSLLSALLDANIAAPFSCTLGQCGACQCHLEGPDGETTNTYMAHNQVLSPEEIAEGERLACQTFRRPGDDPATSYTVSYWF